VSHILIVDDEESICWALQRALSNEGHSVTVASSAEEALTKFRGHGPDAIILDVRLPGISGLQALEQFRKLLPDAAIIVITAFGDLDTAVSAVQGGAFDYLTKPFDLKQALDAVGRALQRHVFHKEARDTEVPPIAQEIVGRSPAMQVVYKRIALVAPRDSCVLITGESGTGKELVARAIHRHGPRRDGPFLPVHVAALNPGLVESELFGHVKGAFTGATLSRPGFLGLANDGTVFLDELADIPLSVQVKLLRVLEHSEYLPVGSNQPERLNVRILAATHQDLLRLVSTNSFRHDLYFRLNVFQIHLPPLRERVEDILPLSEHFLRTFEPRALPLPAQTARFLMSKAWLGNVRELRNALEHAAILSRGGPLLPEHFPVDNGLQPSVSSVERLRASVQNWLDTRIKESRPDAPNNLYEELLRCVEPVLLEEVMRRVEGSRWAAAQWLGLNRTTVRKKLGLYELSQPAGPDDRNE
jgi:two-component system nitrogen regulation response regulator GlnG